MKIQIRQENRQDEAAIYQLVQAAFLHAQQASHTEQDCVNKLRLSTNYIPELSLVATYHNQIIGHIMFSKMKIGQHDSLLLAPLSVAPEWQNKGIGQALIQEGHRLAIALGYAHCVVIGHPGYYPKFGYQPARSYHLEAPFEVPDDVFMVVELIQGSLKDVQGMIQCDDAFNS